MIEKLELYIKNNLQSTTYIKFRKFKYNSEDASCTNFIENDEYLEKEYLDEHPINNLIETDVCFKTKNIDEYINNTKNENKFQKLLFQYIDDRELKDSDVYNKVHIDRRLFSKIRSDCDYHPSKDTVILLGLALELNEEEIIELLDSASYSLPKNNVYDLIIRFCFVEGIYELKEVNSLLENYKCKMFSY